MELKVRTIFLEVKKKAGFIPKEGYKDRIEVREIANDAYLGFILFAGVGLPWKWYSRIGWTINEWDEYFSSGRVKTFLGFDKNKLIGYYELENGTDNDVEIKFFGLFPGFMGRGLGGMLLSHAVESAFSGNAERVWLHTCSSDSEAALGNYISRGFRIYREEENVENVPQKEELVKMISDFYRRYIDHYSIIT